MAMFVYREGRSPLCGSSPWGFTRRLVACRTGCGSFFDATEGGADLLGHFSSHENHVAHDGWEKPWKNGGIINNQPQKKHLMVGGYWKNSPFKGLPSRKWLICPMVIVCVPSLGVIRSLASSGVVCWKGDRLEGPQPELPYIHLLV